MFQLNGESRIGFCTEEGGTSATAKVALEKLRVPQLNLEQEKKTAGTVAATLVI